MMDDAVRALMNDGFVWRRTDFVDVGEAFDLASVLIDRCAAADSGELEVI